MKITLSLMVESEEDRKEAMEYVTNLRMVAERSQRKGFPGALMELSDSGVWVSSVEVSE